MQSSVLHPPKTLLEVYRMLPEGTRAELINDQLFMSPAPTPSHQDSTLDIASQIRGFVMKNKLGKVFISPIDVNLNEKNVVQPDIVFVTKKNLTILKEDGIYGAPDLIIEVLSPGTEKFDREDKRKLYEKFGIREYWIVDPKTKESKGYQLKNSKFVLIKEEKGKLTSVLLKRAFKF
jgi:Uma2 family endonuclease